MSDAPGPAMLATMWGALVLLLVGVTVAGSRSLSMRGKGRRVRAWLVELWGFAVLFACLFSLSARGLGFDLFEAMGRVRDGTMSLWSLCLAVVGGLLGLACAFRMFGLVREGVGQMYPLEDEPKEPTGGTCEGTGSEEPDEERDVR